jgi:predicted O-methyltransferase YrrM
MSHKIPFGSSSYGAGSHYRKSRGLGVKKLGVSAKFGGLLFNLVKFCKPETIIELGTGAGVSIAYLASAAKKKDVVTVEGSSERISFSKSVIESLDLKNISFINADFDDFLKDYTIDRKPFLAFIDGNHLYQPTIRYFKYFSEMADEHSVVILDDIYWSKEMEKAWCEIKKLPEVSITIDLFSMGIVFFRKGNSKQDFKIKF